MFLTDIFVRIYLLYKFNAGFDYKFACDLLTISKINPENSPLLF